MDIRIRSPVLVQYISSEDYILIVEEIDTRQERNHKCSRLVCRLKVVADICLQQRAKIFAGLTSFYI